MPARRSALAASARRLIEWDSLRFRLHGERVAEAVVELAARHELPVERLELDFGEGEIVARGRLARGLPVPFAVSIGRPVVEGRTVRVPLSEPKVLGLLGVPGGVLRHVLRGRLPRGVQYDESSRCLLLSLDALPAFVDLDVQAVSLVRGGVEVVLGRGGVDLPAGWSR